MEKQKLTTDRGLFLFIIFTVITFGFYPLFALTKISKEVNLIVKDGKSTMQYWIIWLLTPITFGIAPLVWWNNICNRIGGELKRRNVNYSISASTYWGWGFFGSLLFGIGMLVFLYKFLTASNKLNESYNQE